MQKRDFRFWKQQIESAQTEHKNYLDTAKKLDKLYTDKDIRINLFYSNVQTLKSALLNNNPRAEVIDAHMRRGYTTPFH